MVVDGVKLLTATEQQLEQDLFRPRSEGPPSPAASTRPLLNPLGSLPGTLVCHVTAEPLALLYRLLSPVVEFIFVMARMLLWPK